MTGHGSFWLLCWKNEFTVDLQYMIVKLQLLQMVVQNTLEDRSRALDCDHFFESVRVKI